MKKMDTNQLNSEENQEDITETTEPEREITESEDIELDVLEAYNELKEGGVESEEDSQTIEVQAEELPEGSEEAETEELPEQEEVETYDPPASWKAEAKEVFEKLPVEIKKDIHRRGKDLDNQIHQVQEERASYRQRYEHIDRALQPFREHFHAKGIREDEALIRMANADKLLDQDIVSGLDHLARMKGTTVQEVAEILANGHESSYPTNQAQNATYEPILNELQLLKSKVLEQEQAKSSESAKAELSEIYSVRDEKDSVTGRYLRPEMHDEAFASEHIIPEYQRLKAQYPNQSPKMLMDQAYVTAVRLVSGKTIQSPVGLSSNNNQIRSRNSGAARSVRGSAVAAPKQVNTPVPDSVEATMLEDARALGYDV